MRAEELTTAVDTIADDRLNGARQISKFMGVTVRRVNYPIEKGRTPVGREGHGYVAAKRKLREYHAQITGQLPAPEAETKAAQTK